MNNETVTVLKSLADETRLTIVRRLAENQCETTSGEIVSACAKSLNLSQPTMSHHFARLVQAGVITERKAGTEKNYTLNIETLNRIGVDVTKL